MRDFKSRIIIFPREMEIGKREIERERDREGERIPFPYSEHKQKSFNFWGQSFYLFVVWNLGEEEGKV